MIDYTQSTYQHIRPGLDEIDWDNVVAIQRKHGEILLDREEYERLVVDHWFTLHPGRNGYIQASARNRKDRRYRALGRAVLGYSGDDVVDHINKNTLDNRKVNLRVVTLSLNNTHRRAKADGRAFRGVLHTGNAHWRQPWRAQLRFQRVMYIGRRSVTQEQAALVYNWMAILAWGHAVELNDVRCMSDLPQPRDHRCEGCHSVCYCCCVCAEYKTPSMLRLADLRGASRDVTDTAC